MFCVGVKDHIMIAHSFNGADFGPAQKLHGATYVIEVEFKSPELNALGVVVDIAAAEEALKKTLEPLKFQNLDDMPDFKGKNTTTEFLAQFIHGLLKQSMAFSGVIKVTLNESHVAWASYEA